MAKSSTRLRNPEVLVAVTEYAPRQIYVGGQVNSPGIAKFQGEITPLQAILDRGGFNDQAQKDSVILIRNTGGPEPIIGRINIMQGLEDGVPEKITLLTNDILYVPMSGIARADLWVKQHLNDILPTGLFGIGTGSRCQLRFDPPSCLCPGKGKLMDFLQIEGKEIPLLEAPQRHEDPPRRILYVLFKHKLMICVIFILLIVPMFLYLLFRSTQYTATAKVLLNPSSREFLNLSPRSGQNSISMVPSPGDDQYRNSNYRKPGIGGTLGCGYPISG